MIFSTRLGRRMRLSISTWMVLVGLLALLPMLVFSIIAGRSLVMERRTAERAALQHGADLAARAVGRELQAMFAMLDTLAASDAARRGDYQELHAYALRVAAALPGVGAITAADSAGTRFFSTLAPYGVKLPETSLKDADQVAIQTGKRVVTSLRTGSLSGRKLVALGIPVQTADKSVFVLRLSLWSDALNALLLEQQWPASWTAALIDQNMAIMARSRDPAKFVGEAATESLQREIRAGRTGLFNSVTKDGTEVVAAIARVPGANWHVAVGEPASAMDADVQRALRYVLWMGLLCAALSAGGSWYLARALGRQFKGVTDVPTQLPAEPLRTSVVKEVGSMTAALTEARAAVRARESALAEARVDAMTGLPWRELFYEQAQERLAAASRDMKTGAAMLFIDLSGMNAANHRGGHRVGDDILVSVAAAIRRELGPEVVGGRIGGDEFVICLSAPLTDLQAVSQQVADRIVAAVDALNEGVGCFIGVALGYGGATVKELINSADMAMLRARQSAKEHVAFAL